MPKEQFREADVIKKISHVSFCIDSAQEIQQTSHLQVKQVCVYFSFSDKIPISTFFLLFRRKIFIIKIKSELRCRMEFWIDEWVLVRREQYAKHAIKA